jgi:tyrosyl-tRNA synthetase
MSLRSLPPIKDKMIFIIYIRIQLPVANGGFRPMGNITTGTELVRRMNVERRGKSVCMTCPLITKADGSKFEPEGGKCG